MDNTNLTKLLYHIESIAEAEKMTHSKMKPEFIEKYFKHEFSKSPLTKAQIKHIIKILS